MTFLMRVTTVMGGEGRARDVPRVMTTPTLRLLDVALVLCALTACGSRGLYDDPSRTFADASTRDRPPGRVTVHLPSALTGLEGTVTDPQGHTVEVPCATCHSVMSPPPTLPSDARAIGGPHAGLRFEHGSNACASCHDPSRYDRLHLATGESIAMTDALRLCAQCHGPQHRDWLHGAHGGMNGCWDRARGDRVRNHCVDCHDPHAPRFPRFLPMPPPRDAVRSHTREGSHE